MTDQAAFIVQLRQLADAIDFAGTKLQKLTALYIANGFGAGGAKEITSVHITESGLDISGPEILEMIDLASNLSKFLGGISSVVKNYQTVLDKVRSIDKQDFYKLY